MPTINEQLFDLMVRHQIGLHRLATQTVRDLSDVLRKHDLGITKLLSGISDQSSIGHVETVLRAVQRANQQAYAEVQVVMVAAMTELAFYEIDFQQRMLASIFTKAVWDQFTFVQPASSSIVSSVTEGSIDGAHLSEYIIGAALGRFTRIRDIVRRRYQEGGSSVTGSIISGVVGTKFARYNDGVFAVALRSLEQITRTIQNGIVSNAKDLLYKENDNLFYGVLWISVLDTSTSDKCWSLSGKLFPLDRGPRPPAHRNCRSAVTPIVKRWSQLGLDNVSANIKEAFDGIAPPVLTYSKWLSQQSAAVQDEVLGPTRGKLFRSGQVSIDRFVDSTGRRYTLDQLKAREGL